MKWILALLIFCTAVFAVADAIDIALHGVSPERFLPVAIFAVVTVCFGAWKKQEEDQDSARARVHEAEKRAFGGS